MAGEIEEPIRLDFQAVSLHSGSISFGRFENEALCWERRSSFSHNRYLEEVERCSKPGLVIEKKAYFEARFRNKGLMMGLNSPEMRNETESQTSENDISDKTINQMSDEILSPCFDEEVYDISTPEAKNEILRDTADKAKIGVKEENIDIKAANSDIGLLGDSNATERSNDASRKTHKDNSSSQAEYKKPGLTIRVSVSQSEKHDLSSKASKGSDKKTSNKIVNKIPVRLKAGMQTLEAATHNKLPTHKTPKNEPVSKARGVINEIKRGEKESRNRRIEETRSSTLRKVPSRVHQSENRIKPAVVMTQPRIKQDTSKFGFKCNERVEKRTEIEKRIHAKKADMNQLQEKNQEKTEAQVKLLRKSLNFKAKPLPSFYHGVVHESSDRNKAKASKIKARKLETKSSTSVGKNRAILITATTKTISDPPLASGATSCHSTVTSESSPSSPAAEITKTTRKTPPQMYKGKTMDGHNIKNKKTINMYTAFGNNLVKGRKAVVLD